jgi:spore coat assembly protein
VIFQRGDLVTRKSYNNDIVFRIDEIVDDVAILVGVNMRLCADAKVDDLQTFEQPENKKIIDDDSFIDKLGDSFNLDRSEYFYIPGRILHIDGDEEYLKRCLKFYKEGKVNAFGLHIKETDMASSIIKHLEEIKPDILVITGHDSFSNKKGDNGKEGLYRNTNNFVKQFKKFVNMKKLKIS